MTIIDLRRRAKQRIDRLSPERLRVADDFLAYLEEREECDATAELLRIPGFMEAFQRAEAQVTAGDVTPLAELLEEGPHLPGRSQPRGT